MKTTHKQKVLLKPVKLAARRSPIRQTAPVFKNLTPVAKVAPTATPVELPRGDSLQLYFREISQVKLLTAQEEIALAKRIKRGDRQAREHMIQANLRLVVKIARAYDGFGLPLLDLINEGNIGLMKGIRRFDPAKGTKLSTYASWWIKQAIKRALSGPAGSQGPARHHSNRLKDPGGRAEAVCHRPRTRSLVSPREGIPVFRLHRRANA